MNRFTEAFKKFFAPLSTAQRAMFGGLTVFIVALVAVLFYWALQPSYSLLFGSLQTDTAQQITQQLDEKGVDYQLKDGGKAIYVNSDKVDELRLEMAPVSASNSDMKGYELFDSNALGMTDFMQQLNNKRALEGELARSINSLEQVESTRIHLVLPERRPFKETSVKASASVILNLKSGQALVKKQITGITALIAGSVEGLDATNVTILDQEGNRLTDGLDSNSDYAFGNYQMKLRQKTESYLTERGQTMLDRVLGPGNSILRVSVDQNFDSLVRKSDLIDPDSRTMISEQQSKQVHNDEGRQPVKVDEFTPVDQRDQTMVVSNQDNETSSRTRNYEVSKTREVFTKAQGDIKRLSASVLINYKQTTTANENGEPVVKTEPYSNEEIAQFRQVVSSALGIQPSRGDQLTITQVQFYDPTNVDGQRPFLDQPTPWNDIIRWSLILLTFITIVYLIYSIKKRLQNNDIGMIMDPGKVDLENIPLAGGEDTEKLEKMSDEEYEKYLEGKLDSEQPKQLKEKEYEIDEIKDFVELKPLEAAQVMRALMTTDDE